MIKKSTIRKWFSNLIEIDTDKFEISSDSEEHENPSDHSAPENSDSNSNAHNHNWIDVKTSWKGLSNSLLNLKIEEKLVEGYWESASLNEIQRKLQNLELEEDKNHQKHTGKIYSFAQSNFIEDAEFALKRRNKKQRLSLDEKILIYISVKFQKQRIIDVARKFGVSIGTVYSILRKLKVCQPNLFSEAGRISRKILVSRRVSNLIGDYLDNTTHPFTWEDISRFIFKSLGIRLKREDVAKILKRVLNMSYKRGQSRPVGFDKKRQDLLKSYFAINIIPLLSQYEILINVDESSFSRAINNVYVVKKGRATELNNIGFSNTTSLITAISSSGKVFAMNTSGSVNSSLFLKFLKSLSRFIEEEWNIWLNKALIILDNATTHRSKKIVAFAKNWDWRLAFIPPYMPEMAPIEKYFVRLKKSILKKTVGMKISWQ